MHGQQKGVSQLACSSAMLAAIVVFACFKLPPPLPHNTLSHHTHYMSVSPFPTLHLCNAAPRCPQHFPDPSVVNQQRAQQFDEEDEQQFYDSSAEDPSTHAAGARAGQQQESEQQEQRQQQLHDHDGARAAYAAAAFTALLQAGWDPAVRNDNGYSVSDLILEGLSRYQTGVSVCGRRKGVVLWSFVGVLCG